MKLAQVIRTQIPLSNAMGLKVKLANPVNGVEFQFPLKPNHNHKNTAFGGSLVAGQALACWAWLMVWLESMSIHAEVILQRQEAQFLRPVDSLFFVNGKPASELELKRFLVALHKKNKARIILKASVKCRGKICSEYTGEYVAIKQ